jgi:hypothetical protein
MYSIVCVSLSYDTRNVFSLFSVKYMGSCPLNRKKIHRCCISLTIKYLILSLAFYCCISLHSENLCECYMFFRECMAWKPQSETGMEQHRSLCTRLGPLYLFYFSLICFCLMFYTFAIYSGLVALDTFSGFSLFYGVLALGEN